MRLLVPLLAALALLSSAEVIFNRDSATVVDNTGAQARIVAPDNAALYGQIELNLIMQWELPFLMKHQVPIASKEMTCTNVKSTEVADKVKEESCVSHLPEISKTTAMFMKAFVYEDDVAVSSEHPFPIAADSIRFDFGVIGWPEAEPAAPANNVGMMNGFPFRIGAIDAQNSNEKKMSDVQFKFTIDASGDVADVISATEHVPATEGHTEMSVTVVKFGEVTLVIPTTSATDKVMSWSKGEQLHLLIDSKNGVVSVYMTVSQEDLPSNGQQDGGDEVKKQQQPVVKIENNHRVEIVAGGAAAAVLCIGGVGLYVYSKKMKKFNRSASFTHNRKYSGFPTDITPEEIVKETAANLRRRVVVPEHATMDTDGVEIVSHMATDSSLPPIQEAPSRGVSMEKRSISRGVSMEKPSMGNLSKGVSLERQGSQTKVAQM